MKAQKRKAVKKVREHAGQLHGGGMTSLVHDYLTSMSLKGLWVSPHDVIRSTGCTAPTTFFSDINSRLPQSLKVCKKWFPNRGKRGCYGYKLCKV